MAKVGGTWKKDDICCIYFGFTLGLEIACANALQAKGAEGQRQGRAGQARALASQVRIAWSLQRHCGGRVAFWSHITGGCLLFKVPSGTGQQQRSPLL